MLSAPDLTTPEERELEERIERAQLRLMAASGPDACKVRREAWDELARLIRQRSPAQVERMERDRGLR